MRASVALLALRAGRAYDKNLPFLGEFQRSLGKVRDKPLKCGRGEGLDEIRGGCGGAVGRRG
jgi:hypothetical protein